MVAPDAPFKSQRFFSAVLTCTEREAKVAKPRGLIREFWNYVRVRKKWWLAPIIIVMALIAGLLASVQGSALAPFIYTIF